MSIEYSSMSIPGAEGQACDSILVNAFKVRTERCNRASNVVFFSTCLLGQIIINNFSEGPILCHVFALNIAPSHVTFWSGKCVIAFTAEIDRDL